MRGADEVAELRSLQAKAYGRDGALTDAEAARLHELETAGRRPWSAEERVVDVPSLERESSPIFGAETETETKTETETETETVPASLRTALRTHIRTVAAAAVAVLALGVGVGWLAFGSHADAAVALDAERQGWQDAVIATGIYDPGSVRAIAVEEDAVVWIATSQQKERTCLILGTATVTMPNCNRTENVREAGIYGSITVDVADGNRREVNAQVFLTASGEPAAVVQTYDYGPGDSGMVYANEEETATAERLVGEGYDPNSIWVVGYDRGVPIWTAAQVDTGWQCLVHDGSTEDSAAVCEDATTLQEQSAALVLDVRDPVSGALTRYEMASRGGPTSLVITREGGIADAGGE
jgi:hypothetical protein